MFQENDTRKEGDLVPGEDRKGARIDAKKAELFNKYLTF